MIVRDESAVIQRCLESVKPYIDYWVIVDTGSKDDTINLIKQTLQDIPGELHLRPFDTFSNSRNHALDLAENDHDYVLLIDADMELKVEDENFKQGLTLDGYYLPVTEARQYHNLRIVKNDLLWQYIGSTHEFLVSQDATNILKHDKLSIVHHLDGSSRKIKNQRDKALLTASLKEAPEDNHAIFYLARIALQEKHWQQALDLFNRMLSLTDHWDEEWVWYSGYMRAKIMEKLEHSSDAVTNAYLLAFERRPQRAEPLYELARYHREQQNFVTAEIYGNKAMQLPIPNDLFDLDKSLYTWTLPTEYALICYRLGLHEKTVSAANLALQELNITRNARDSLLASRQRSLDILNTQRRCEEIPETYNSIKVIVPFRNAGNFLSDCIESLQVQKYTHFTATFIDDCSDDGSGDLVPTDDPRFNLITNKKRIGPLLNRSNFIFSCAPDDIIVYLDGDDQLASDDALSYINSIYNEYDCWLTYGQYISQNGNLGWAFPYANWQEFENVMSKGDMKFPMHPLTHRAGLMHRLKDFDPKLKCFKDDNDDWLFYASDAVLARPLFHMAGWQKIMYINRVLYLYTEGHAISESIHNKDDQLETCRMINTRMRPPRLERYQAD